MESWLLSACLVGWAVVTYPKLITFTRFGSSFKEFLFKFGKTIQLHKGGGDAKTSAALQHLVLSKQWRGRHLKFQTSKLVFFVLFVLEISDNF